jgi:putative peptide zinc metalloprotease protein
MGIGMAELIKLMSDLYRADVLQGDAPPDIREQHDRRGKHLKMKIKQYVGNPMSLRFPLVDPDRALQRIVNWVRPIFSRLGAVVWCATMAIALVMLARHWREFSDGMLDRVFSVENLLLIGVLFPLVKVLHELGHALAVKVRGGEVHEMGVMLLLLMPIPYVDASAASAFADKRWRMLVGAAGMLVELFIAAIAMILWVYLEPGINRAITYNIVLIAGVSTLVFNANPFLRYDGYYILSDYLEIPNLGQRSNDYMGYLVNRYLFAVANVQTPVVAKGEPAWFVFYGLASFVYRMFMMVSIVLIVAGKFFLFGVLMAAWSIFNMLVQPIAKKVVYLVSSPKLNRTRVRALGISFSVVLSAALALFWLPAPSYTRGIAGSRQRGWVHYPSSGAARFSCRQGGAVGQVRRPRIGGAIGRVAVRADGVGGSVRCRTGQQPGASGYFAAANCTCAGSPELGAQPTL